MAKLKQRTQAEWTKRNPTYWTERRLATQIEQAREGNLKGVLRGPPAEMARTPVDIAQDAIGVEGLVIMAFMARIIHLSAQDAMRQQLMDIKGEIRAINPFEAQDATAPRGPDP